MKKIQHTLLLLLSVVMITSCNYQEEEVTPNDLSDFMMSEEISFKQLKKWNLKYHKLIFGKPSFDIFVDDKSFGFKKNWHVNFKYFLKHDFKKN